MPWNDAIDWCNDLDHAGHTDWCLPNLRELLSLIDVSKYHTALPDGYPFTNVLSLKYWSSTASSFYSEFAWTMDMICGSVLTAGKFGTAYIWPVRGGH